MLIYKSLTRRLLGFTRGEKWSGRHAADGTTVTQGFISCTPDAITSSAAI
jgi:hypothetical protein